MNPFALLFPFFLTTPAPVAGMAQDPATDPQCATVRVAMPPEFARWSERTPLTAGATPRTAPVLAVGRASDLTLIATEEFSPVVRPARPAEPRTSGGIAMFQIAHAGTYRVALGARAWVDVIQARRAMASVAHGHGPMCTGIRKIVDFRLRPGRYLLQLSGSSDPTLPVMIAREAPVRAGA